MREGINPSKLDPKVPKQFYHRIILPIYIPNFSGYFQDILEVYKICIESAYLTQHSRSAITVVDNGSCQEIKDWLKELFDQGKIETLITHQTNIGKVDAILGAARGCREEIITLSDSDILFNNGWQEAVEEIFIHFKNAGSVAPFPISRHMYYYSTAVQKAVVRKELNFRFERSNQSESIKENYECYNWNFDEDYDSLLPVIFQNGYKAVVGSGHQVMTFRREAIFSMPFDPCYIKISSGSENFWIDQPIDDAGFWRLSTVDTWVNHMGNKLTSRNSEVFSSLQKNQNQTDLIKLPKINPNPIGEISQKVYRKLFKKIYESRPPAPKLKVHLEQDGLGLKD